MGDNNTLEDVMSTLDKVMATGLFSVIVLLIVFCWYDVTSKRNAYYECLYSMNSASLSAAELKSLCER